VKVLFLYPNRGAQLGFQYGIAQLSSVLKAAGHDTALWQLCEELAPLPTYAEFAARLQREAPDVIGFSVVTPQWPYARTLAAWARRAVPDALLVCGGIHALAAPHEVLGSGAFDLIVRGEAEEAFLELVDKRARGAELSGIRNLGWVEAGKIRLNPLRPLPDLNRLPMKDYEIFDFQRLIDAKNGWVGLMASRGCPFACTYCFNHQLVARYRAELGCSFGGLNYIRHVRVPALMDEIDFLLRRYRNIRMLIFDDDLFTFRRAYVAEFCEAYRRRFALPFVVNAHVGFFDRERARHLAAAGCRIVKFGVESGSARIREEILNRRMSNARIAAALSTAAEFGLHTSVFLMIGLPGETREDVAATLDLMAEARPGRFRWSFFYPFPGTRAAELAAQSGAVDPERLARLENFTDASALDFGPEHNLFLEKVGRAMPWFVNARCDFPAAAVYRRKVAELLELDAAAWRARAPQIPAEDRRLSEELAARGMRHYAIRYNPFMGVVSDYFLAERD
jgi:radical SAM superfamily enzyme YgiQ (UPF0313 family)